MDANTPQPIYVPPPVNPPAPVAKALPTLSQLQAAYASQEKARVARVVDFLTKESNAADDNFWNSKAQYQDSDGNPQPFTPQQAAAALGNTAVAAFNLHGQMVTILLTLGRTDVHVDPRAATVVEDPATGRVTVP